MDGEKKNPLKSVLMACGVAVILLTPMGVFVALRSNEHGQAPVEEPAPLETTAAAKPASRNAIPVLEPQRQAAPAPRPSPMPVPPQRAQAPARAFPTPKDIPIGIDKSWLIDSYGRPNMVTTEVTEGRALETFRYLKPEAGTEVVVYLSSGKVIGASASVY